MLHCILFCSALAALPTLVSAQALDPAAPGAGAQAPVTAPEMTHEQKLTQYRRDQINLLALHADPGSLVAAALFAEADAGDNRRPAALKSPALLKRAQESGDSSALVWWVTAATECHTAAKTCPSTETLQKLESLDAENAAVWLLSLWHARQANDTPSARAALTSAAQAKRYNDYFGALVSLLYEQQDVLPMSNDLLNATGADASVAGYRLITAANIAVSHVSLPGGQALVETCQTKEPPEAELLADCVAVARKMELSGSLFAQNAGLVLRESLLPPGPDLDALRVRKRALAWQMQSMSELASHLARETEVTRTYTQALAGSSDESAAVYAVLRSQHVALEPPAGWQPPETKAPGNP